MGLRLIVMRHAKSSWNSDAPTDHRRPLNKRGRRDAPRIGERLRQLGWLPDLVLSSDSTRTRQTWQGLASALGDDIEVEFTRELYHGGHHALMEAIAAVPTSVRTLLVLGHNPSWEEAVEWLTGEDTPMTTANAALLWSDVQEWGNSVSRPNRWTLEQVLRPKELDDSDA